MTKFMINNRTDIFNQKHSKKTFHTYKSMLNNVGLRVVNIEINMKILLLCFADLLDGDPHTNHFYIGFWVICGLFGFLTLEKVFSEENEEDNSNTKKEKEGKVRMPQQWYNACY